MDPRSQSIAFHDHAALIRSWPSLVLLPGARVGCPHLTSRGNVCYKCRRTLAAKNFFVKTLRPKEVFRGLQANYFGVKNYFWSSPELQQCDLFQVLCVLPTYASAYSKSLPDPCATSFHGCSYILAELLMSIAWIWRMGANLACSALSDSDLRSSYAAAHLLACDHHFSGLLKTTFDGCQARSAVSRPMVGQLHTLSRCGVAAERLSYCVAADNPAAL